ncbi:integrase core domain-containing protein [Nocardia sp. NPDC058058]|uniref:integrase core domain-containing protein n=1 Tax=Nocardia sp. NPDC058058 TaxID=3346317 RepID=UPI0036D97BAD
MPQARVVISDWKDEYNYRRRHSALGYNAQPDTLQSASTDNRLSHTVDRIMGSR